MTTRIHIWLGTCLLLSCSTSLFAKVHDFIHSSNTRASFAISRDGDDKRLYSKMKANLDFVGRKTIMAKDQTFRLMCSPINCSVAVPQSRRAEISFSDNFVRYTRKKEDAAAFFAAFKLKPGEKWIFTSSDKRLIITVAEDLFIYQFGEPPPPHKPESLD